MVVLGRWIADCAHEDYHTEVHPPLLLANARGAKAGEGTHSMLISRPYLISQEYLVDGDDDGATLEHFLNEIGKVQTF